MFSVVCIQVLKNLKIILQYPYRLAVVNTKNDNLDVEAKVWQITVLNKVNVMEKGPWTE